MALYVLLVFSTVAYMGLGSSVSKFLRDNMNKFSKF